MKIWVSVFNEKGKKVEEKELREYRVTGWEDAPSHKNLPRLKEIGGMQSPLDMAFWALGKYNPKWNYVIFCKDERVKVIARGKTQGNYIAVRGNSTGTYATLVHVNGHDKYVKETIISQGQAICKIAPKEENGGYPEHLHVDMVKGKVLTRDLIFYQPVISTCEDKLKTLQNENATLRKDIQTYNVKLDQKNTEIAGLKSQSTRLNEVLIEKEKMLTEVITERDELLKVNTSLRKKRKADLEDFTVKQVIDFITSKRVNDLRLRILDWIDTVLPYLRKSS